MKQRIMAAVLLGLLLTASPGHPGEASPFAAGISMTGIYLSAGFDSRLSNGGNSMDYDWEPELTFEYYLSKGISLEYGLLFSRHSFSYGIPVRETGATSLFTQGFTAKLHLAPGSTLDPYVGGGLNYLVPFDTGSTVPGFFIDSHLGWTLQAGAELKVSNATSLIVDYRYMDMATKARTGGVAYRFDISSNLVAIGVKYRY